MADDNPTFVHDAFDSVEEEFNGALDESLNPVGPESLYDYVAEMGLPAGAVAIDVGCGSGRHSAELARRFGFRVTGVDPVPRQGDGFLAGIAEDLPVASGSADLVWCRDVLCLVEDLGRAYREFRRVLKPGGRVMVYQMFATSRLESAEAAFLLPVMGCPATAMRPETTEAAIAGAGLRVDRLVVAGTQWGEYAQENRGDPGRRLLHAARLIRDPGRYIARFGKQNYDIKLGDCLWHVYRMIGKLSGRVYLLSAPEQAHD